MENKQNVVRAYYTKMLEELLYDADSLGNSQPLSAIAASVMREQKATTLNRIDDLMSFLTVLRQEVAKIDTKEREGEMIQAFVATTQTQGQRENDFCFVPEGELVTFSVLTCTNEEPDGTCGCCRSMSGVVTHKATTTMKVIETDQETVKQAILTFFREAGWSTMWSLPVEYARVEETVARIAAAASRFAVGTVVELRGDACAARAE